MSGLVTTTSRNGAGSGYADGNPTFRRFTASATILKPLGCTIIVMEVIGGGGGGASGYAGGGAGGLKLGFVATASQDIDVVVTYLEQDV